MTAVADATLVIETLIGRSLTGQQLSNIGARFVAVDPFNLGGWWDITDPDNPVPRDPTNEEAAELVLATFRRYGRAVVGEDAGRAKRTELEGTIDAEVQAAIDAALADIT